MYVGLYIQDILLLVLVFVCARVNHPFKTTELQLPICITITHTTAIIVRDLYALRTT